MLARFQFMEKGRRKKALLKLYIYNLLIGSSNCNHYLNNINLLNDNNIFEKYISSLIFYLHFIIYTLSYFAVTVLQPGALL